jgi:hypothetical protein
MRFCVSLRIRYVEHLLEAIRFLADYADPAASNIH